MANSSKAAPCQQISELNLYWEILNRNLTKHYIENEHNPTTQMTCDPEPKKTGRIVSTREKPRHSVSAQKRTLKRSSSPSESVSLDDEGMLYGNEFLIRNQNLLSYTPTSISSDLPGPSNRRACKMPRAETYSNICEQQAKQYREHILGMKTSKSKVVVKSQLNDRHHQLHVAERPIKKKRSRLCCKTLTPTAESRLSSKKKVRGRKKATGRLSTPVSSELIQKRKSRILVRSSSSETLIKLREQKQKICNQLEEIMHTVAMRKSHSKFQYPQLEWIPKKYLMECTHHDNKRETLRKHAEECCSRNAIVPTKMPEEIDYNRNRRYAADKENYYENEVTIEDFPESGYFEDSSSANAKRHATKLQLENECQRSTAACIAGNLNSDANMVDTASEVSLPQYGINMGKIPSNTIMPKHGRHVDNIDPYIFYYKPPESPKPSSSKKCKDIDAHNDSNSNDWQGNQGSVDRQKGTNSHNERNSANLSSHLNTISQNVEQLKKELMSNLLQEKRSCSQISHSDSQPTQFGAAGNRLPIQSTQPLCVCEDVETSYHPVTYKFEKKTNACDDYDSSETQQSSVETEVDSSNSHCNNKPSPLVNYRQLTYPTQFQNWVSNNYKDSATSCRLDCIRATDQNRLTDLNSSISISEKRCETVRHSRNKQASNYDLNSLYKQKTLHSEKKRKRKRCTQSSRSTPKYLHRKLSMSAELNEESECCVRVAVRIRPQNSREKIDLCRVCTSVTSGEPQIVLGLDKAFTYDYVFDMDSCQQNIYEMCVERLVEGALNGYNATVLAYGQTGSGKTHTMGTGFERDLHDEHIGIIPRAVHHIFSGIEELQSRISDDDMGMNTRSVLQFSVAVQFIELYNEDIIDLLDPYSKDRSFKIHENGNREITITGATIKPIHSPEDALKCLQQGALARTTASTKMNDQSSRSHALFTILIRRQRLLPENDLETLTSKFNFVDLAGSERLKRTGATGERAREGISINCGLLALGNCISALGDISKKATHVPYRDSKLTRLLQDSLGGNSQTLMIACISPSDRDFMETLNTLKYANRARNIKNRVQINQDQSSRTICQLRREIAALQLELLEFKQGKRNVDVEGTSALTDTFHENAMLTAENRRLKQRIKSLQETINVVTEKNIQLKLEKETHGWSPLIDSENSVTAMIAGYLSEIEKLQAKLIESEEMYQQLKKSCNTNIFSPRGLCKAPNGYENPEDLINLAKRDIEKDREMLMSKSMSDNANNCNNADNAENTENEIYESDDSDTESEEKTNEMQADLNDINSDIEIKSKLIEQLELSQQRMQLMRQHYEEKLDVLNSKIINTQKERDEVLSNMSSKHGSHSNDQVKKVRDEYERKINDMHRELKKLQQAQREHARQQREMQAQEAKLRNLRAELDDLKNSKTRLMRKISEQTNRHKEEDTRRIREIAQLRKEQRRQQNTVKTLQAKMQAKDQILKRKTEEVTALRRNQRSGLSQKAAGRVNKKDDPATFNTRVARTRWDHIFRSISRAARNKQLLVQLEQELERLMRERDELSHELANVRNRQRLSKSSELANEEDTIKSNLNYVQENISLVQQSIMECEEGKEAGSNGTPNLQELIYNIKNLDEAKFVLERLTDSAVMLTCNTSLTQSRLQEHETLLKEVQQESGIQQQLLQHFLSQNNAAKISDLFDSLNLGKMSLLSSSHFKASQNSLHSNDTYDIPPADGGMTNSSYGGEINSKSRSISPVVPMVDFESKTVKIPLKANHKFSRSNHCFETVGMLSETLTETNYKL